MAAVSTGLQRKATVAQGIIDFTVNQFPQILRQHTPFEIRSAAPSNPTLLSPYAFEIFDLIQGASRPQVFSTVADLVQNLDIATLSAPLQEAELIGIDESQVDIPLPQSSLSYLKSAAFRSYELPDGTRDEAVGPIVSDMRMQLGEDDAFENENKLLGYIRNNFIAYISAITALPYGNRRPFIVLHGPLVRTIGGFSHLTFNYETACNLLNINLAEAGEFSPPQGTANRPVVQGDSFTAQNLSFTPSKALDGVENIRQFNKFCLQSCGRQCDAVEAFHRRNAVPGAKMTQQMIQNRNYPGFCLYFWVLRSLVDLARLSKITITSVVEDVSAATEMNRFVLPSLLAIPNARQQVTNSALQPALQETNINYSPQQTRTDIYREVKHTIEKLRLLDSNTFSYILAEGQYTAPIQIYRYRTRNTFVRALGDRGLGIDNDLEPILDKLFPSEPQSLQSGSHPGYRVLMSYVRTTPLREPVRVEYFDLPHLTHQQVIGPIYLLSLPYQEYGIPIILYYADKLARTPTKLVRTIVEQEYLELILQQSLSGNNCDPVTFMRLLGRLTRNYFQRDGM
jgi:hypothetical protein